MSGISTALTNTLNDLGPRRTHEVDQILLTGSASVTSRLASQLDNEIRLLDQLSKSLKFRRNDCCRLLRLPPEILAEILTIVSRDDPPHQRRMNELDLPPEARKSEAAHLGFIRVGHVCRRLREQLLSQRSLWAAIAFSLPKASKDILKRAGETPLVISLNDGYYTPLHIAHSAARQFERARVITIGDTVPHLSSFLWPFSPKDVSEKCFPFLEELTLKMMGRPGGPQLNLKPEVYELPPLNAPRLRRLALLDYFVPFNGANLTSLELNYFVHPSHGALPTAAQFWNLIRSCSNIVDLYLANCTPDMTEPTNRPAQPIPFERVSSLRIADSIDRIRVLWDCIRVPPSANIDLRLYSQVGSREESPGPEDVADYQTSFFNFITTLAPHVRGSTTSRPISGLGVYEDFQDDAARFVIATHNEGAHLPAETGPFAHDTDFILSLSLSAFGSDVVHIDLLDMLQRVIQNYALDGVETFEISTPQPYEQARVMTALRPLATVRTLVLDAFPDVAHNLGICDVLFTSKTPHDPNSSVLPNLERIWIIEVSYMHDEVHSGLAPLLIAGLDAPTSSPWPRLLEVLARRNTQGARLQHLVVPAWYTDDLDGSERMVERLKRHVDNVEITMKEEHPSPMGHLHPSAVLNGLNLETHHHLEELPVPW